MNVAASISGLQIGDHLRPNDMEKGEQNFSPRGPVDYIVDFRYSLLIEEILSRKWIMSVQVNASQLAEILDVSRTTLSCWRNRKTGISIPAATRFEGRGGLQGFFSAEVLRIHDEIRNHKARRFEVWIKQYMEQESLTKPFS